jgi:hypothetical protein
MNRIVYTLLILLFISCDDIVEKDIRDDTVELVAPADNAVVAEGDIMFWWNELQGASQYELQVVSPNMLSPQTLVLDTVITKHTFTLSLPAGNYQWCVKAINTGYVTQSSCRMLEVED